MALPALSSPHLLFLALFTALSVGDAQEVNSTPSLDRHQLIPHWTVLPVASADAIRWENRNKIYPKTTNSLSSAASLGEQDSITDVDVMKSISPTTTTGVASRRQLTHLVKRDVIKVQESLLSSSSSSSLSLTASTMSARIDQSLSESSNGAICRNGSNLPDPAGSCTTNSINGTKSSADGNQTYVTPYYTIINLDNHNDVLCDEEYYMEEYNENCFIDHNVTCVGDPLYCNLTNEEYQQLLMDYIYPSTAEWILIASHSVVFIMGLVSTSWVVFGLNYLQQKSH